MEDDWDDEEYDGDDWDDEEYDGDDWDDEEYDGDDWDDDDYDYPVRRGGTRLIFEWIVAFAGIGAIGIALLVYNVLGILMGWYQSPKYGVIVVSALVMVASSYVGMYKTGYKAAVSGIENTAVVTTVQDDKEN